MPRSGNYGGGHFHHPYDGISIFICGRGFPHCSYTGHEISYSLHADSCRKFFLWGRFVISGQNGGPGCADGAVPQEQEKLAPAGILSNDWFWGMIDGGHLTEKRVLQIMGRLRDGTSEIMCHPSADEAAMEPAFTGGITGAVELEALLSPEVRAAVREKRIRLISYRDLAEEQQSGEY